MIARNKKRNMERKEAAEEAAETEAKKTRTDDDDDDDVVAAARARFRGSGAAPSTWQLLVEGHDMSDLANDDIDI